MSAVTTKKVMSTYRRRLVHVADPALSGGAPRVIEVKKASTSPMNILPVNPEKPLAQPSHLKKPR
jgi:hypothetical protein